jgi:hypothetical protein
MAMVSAARLGVASTTRPSLDPLEARRHVRQAAGACTSVCQVLAAITGALLGGPVGLGAVALSAAETAPKTSATAKELIESLTKLSKLAGSVAS